MDEISTQTAAQNAGETSSAKASNDANNQSMLELSKMNNDNTLFQAKLKTLADQTKAWSDFLQKPAATAKEMAANFNRP